MTRTEFFATAVAAVAAIATAREAEAELLIQKVTPENVGDSGFEVAFRRGESGLVSFSLVRTRTTTAHPSLRLSVGPEVAPVVVCFLQPKEDTLRTRRALTYRFEVGEKYLDQTQLRATDALPKHLGGTVYEFDLKSFVNYAAYAK